MKVCKCFESSRSQQGGEANCFGSYPMLEDFRGFKGWGEGVVVNAYYAWPRVQVNDMPLIIARLCPHATMCPKFIFSNVGNYVNDGQ